MALKDKNVPLWLESPLVELIEADGKIKGAVVNHKGQDIRVKASKGVVLAAGGFEKNAQMREENLPLYPKCTLFRRCYF